MNLQQRVSQLGNPSDPSNQIHLEDVQRTHVGKRRWVQRIVKIVLAVHFWQTTLMIAPVYAQTAPATRQTANVAPLLTRATNAPTGQKPIIDAAPNGVPIVLIAPPSLGGVSRNQYNDFNVGQRGLILNNSKGEVNTQLGGIVSGNLQLGKVQARIILNEVTSTNPSQLNGFIEVAGQRADIVIANPNGITCDGCGFLNTAGRVTLTTGTSQFDNGGNLDSLSVQRGLVTVGAGGLNAADINQLDLLARGIVIEGEILTQNLQAVLGANKVLYGTLKATAQDGGAAANAPKFAVDIVELGGLFANQVYLIATDKGLGVNSRGRIAALEGNITLNAQGDVNLHDNYSKNDINLNAAGSVSLSGQTGADNNVVITAPTQITNSQTATLRAGQQVLLNTNKLDNGGSIIQSGANHAFNLTVSDAIDNRGLIYSANDLNLQSQAIGGIGGTLLAENGLSVRAGGINFTGQQVFANQDIKLDASTIAIKKSVLHANAVNLNGAQSFFSDGSEVSAVQDVRLASDAAGGQISVQNSTIIGGAQIALGAADVGFTASKLSAGTGLSIDGNQVQVQQSQLLAQQQLALTSQTALNLDGSNVTSQGSVQLQGQGISTQAALIAADQVQVQAGNGKLDNRAGTVYANRRLDVAAIGVDNGGGRIGSQGELVLDAQGGVVDNNNGLITASNSVLRNVSGILNRNGSIYTTNDFALTGVIDNHLGKLLTDGALILNSSTIDNSGGVLQARNTIQLNGDVLNNSAGVIQSTAGGIKLQSGLLDNNGAAIAAGAGIDLQTTSLQNQNGSISANGDASITATNIASNAGAIGAGGTLSVKGSALDFSSARLGSNGALTLVGDNINADHAQVQSGATVSLTSNSLSANSAQLLATKEANLDIVADASLNKANIGAGSNLTLTSRTLNAAELQVSSNKTLTITAQDVNLQQAQIIGLNGVDLHADDLNLSGAKASSGVDLTVRAKQQTGGDLSAQGNLNVQLQNGLNLSGGALTAGQSLTVTAQGITTDQARVNGNQIILDAGNQALHNQGGQIVAQGVGNSGLEVRAVGIDNRGGSLRSGSDVLLDTKGETLDSSAGNIVAGRDLHISASSLKNTGGSLGVAGNAQIDAATVDNSNGSINIIGNAQINATTLNNRSGSFSIGNSISLIGQEIDNTQGQLQSGTNINIDTLGKSLVNDGGLIQAQGQLTLAAGRLSNASGNFA
ncbi:MAG: filamentous hemagglutinin N-terminal domain-containing protein, partial [Burkholderiaceae bacterium]|nr:filamentous hemagglutinin N-terminal domain-containing protein [Burkholderiaceae bacterium]